MPHTGSPVSEKNSSRKVGEQARVPTSRHRIGVASVRLQVSEKNPPGQLGEHRGHRASYKFLRV